MWSSQVTQCHYDTIMVILNIWFVIRANRKPLCTTYVMIGYAKMD